MLDIQTLNHSVNRYIVRGYHARTSLDGTGFSIRFESIKCRFIFSVLLTSLSNPLLYDSKMDTREEIRLRYQPNIIHAFHPNDGTLNATLIMQHCIEREINYWKNPLVPYIKHTTCTVIKPLVMTKWYGQLNRNKKIIQKSKCTD